MELHNSYTLISCWKVKKINLQIFHAFHSEVWRASPTKSVILKVWKMWQLVWYTTQTGVARGRCILCWLAGIALCFSCVKLKTRHCATLLDGRCNIKDYNKYANHLHKKAMPTVWCKQSCMRPAWCCEENILWIFSRRLLSYVTDHFHRS